MSLARFLFQIGFAAALAAAGLAGGWFARMQTELGAPPQAEEEAESEAFLSPQALKNMGVTWGKAVKGDYVVWREVPAVVEETPSCFRPVVARWGGTVRAVLPAPADEAAGGAASTACEGLVVQPGRILFEVIRAPIPVIDRSLTGEIVQAVSEKVHEAATDLRSACRTLEVAEIELKRVRDLNEEGDDELPLIPRQTEINLKYEVLKARAEVDRLRSRLYLHGLTEEQIDAVSGNTPAPSAPALWRRALERNGLWNASADMVLALLPERLRLHPWTFAGLGELNALGLCQAPLLDALKGTPGLAGAFHELVALVQNGHSLPDITDLFRTGFLDPRVRIPAPPGPSDWEVREILVKPGEMVEAGTILAILANPAKVLLEIEAPGADLALVERALHGRSPLDARPLIEGAGPSISGVRLVAFRNRSAGGSPPRAYALVQNVADLHESGGGTSHRTWRLRPGMRYMVRLPVRSIAGGFVLPRRAVVKDGVERVLFIRSGDGFRRQPVHLLHEDFEVVVVADDGCVFPGDPVVFTGAFSVSLALKAEGASDEEHRHGAT